MNDYKYVLNQDKTATIVVGGREAVLGEVIHAKTHDGLHGSNDMREVRICLHDFRKGVDGKEKDQRFPRFLREFKNGHEINQKLLDNLCTMSNHCREAEEKYGELTQLIELVEEFERHGAIKRELQYCGPTCLYQ